MDKEKLLLIKEILIYADEEKIKLLPADVVPKLLKESIDILQTLKNDESEHKPLYLEFAVKADIEDKELKKQLLEEIMEIGKTIPSYDEDKTKKFNQYVTSIIKFNTLGPTKEQLLSWAKKTKNRGKDSQSRMNKIIDEFQTHEFSNQEILSVCQSYLSSDIGITDADITLLNIHFILSNEDIYQWLKEKEISRENFLKYLSWAMEKSEIASLLDEDKFFSLEINAEEVDQLLTKMKNQKSRNLDLEEILLNDNFQSLVCCQNINISSFLEFLQEIEEKEDHLSLEVFNALISEYWNEIYEETNLHDNSWPIIELSQKLASIIRKVPEKYPENLITIIDDENFVQLLGREEDLKNSQTQLIHLCEFLSQQDEMNLDLLIKILEYSNISGSMNSISELISFFKQFVQLDSSLIESLHQSITSSNVKYLSYNNEQIYQVYPYLIGKLSAPVTKLEEKQLETALSVLDHAKYGETDTLNIYRGVIDLIFETRYNWQRQNIIDVASEDYPSNLNKDAYLSSVFYMSKMKERDKNEIPPECFAPSYELYQKQIDEVNNLLKQLEENRPKILQKK